MAPPRVPRPFPLAPLVDAAGFPNRSQLGAALGISGKSLVDADRNGLSDVQADRYACRLGLHPLEVWGLAWVRDYVVWAGEALL